MRLSRTLPLLVAALPLTCLAVDTAAAQAAPTARPATAPAAGTVITEPDDSYTPVYDFINAATSTLDMTMYELADATAVKDLVAAADRGVDVRVILDQNREKSNNTEAYNTLTAGGVHVVWADADYAATHQKTITIDDKESLILTANLTSRYYSTGREFGYVDDDQADVAAIEQTFEADFASRSITPDDGDDLVWSPTDSQDQLLGLINGAKTSLDIENEEMAYDTITDALIAAAKRGVDVYVTMTNSYNDYADEFDELTAAGVHVRTYSDSASLYIHAKVISADVGTSTAKIFVGSENFSNASLNENRELGFISTDSSVITTVTDTVISDYKGGTTWS